MGLFIEKNVLLAVKRYVDEDPARRGMEATYVLRHAGRGAASNWIVRGLWANDASPGPAETLYDKIDLEMRQGGVALVRGGVIERIHTAPTLRTRW